jgi:hypothetical protein
LRKAFDQTGFLISPNETKKQEKHYAQLENDWSCVGGGSGGGGGCSLWADAGRLTHSRRVAENGAYHLCGHAQGRAAYARRAILHRRGPGLCHQRYAVLRQRHLHGRLVPEHDLQISEPGNIPSFHSGDSFVKALLYSAIALLVATSSASAYRLRNTTNPGAACTQDGNPCDVFCDNGPQAGVMYWNGTVWTDGTKWDVNQDAEARKICAAQGTSCL